MTPPVPPSHPRHEKPVLEVQAWLVDLDGTLYSAPPMKRRMALELALGGLMRARLLSQFRQVHEELREQQKQDPLVSFGSSPYEEQLQRTATRFDKSVDEVRTIVTEWMIERPCKHLRGVRRESLVEEIRAFKAGGGKLAVVSDYPVERKLAALEVRDLFDVVVGNGETIGLSRIKPAPDGYLLAARLLDCPPEHCLVLGDRDDADGAAARAAGMRFRHVVG
ncbi:MAG TPA: HAD-IA family hydrolase [Polyangiaceae bacterium]|nr:HAD-IA family hydrolase [Polyangiaceae bacterium]